VATVAGDDYLGGSFVRARAEVVPLDVDSSVVNPDLLQRCAQNLLQLALFLRSKLRLLRSTCSQLKSGEPRREYIDQVIESGCTSATRRSDIHLPELRFKGPTHGFLPPWRAQFGSASWTLNFLEVLALIDERYFFGHDDFDLRGATQKMRKDLFRHRAKVRSGDEFRVNWNECEVVLRHGAG